MWLVVLHEEVFGFTLLLMRYDMSEEVLVVEVDIAAIVLALDQDFAALVIFVGLKSYRSFSHCL